MKLLAITEETEESEQFEEFDDFFEVTETRLDRVAPEIIGKKQDIRIDGKSVREFDAAYLAIPPKNAVFGRVMVEMMEELGLETNYTSTAFFIMAKKNYLYHVLHERGLPAPKTVSLATEKAARNIERELELPVIARRFEELSETETRKMESSDEIQDFAEGSEYAEDVLLFHEFNEGDRYRCLVTGDDVISLEDDSEGWWFSTENLRYSNISEDQKEIVRKTARALGTNVAEILLRNGKVYDINPNPDLQLYTDESGKNAHKAVSQVLKGEGD